MIAAAAARFIELRKADVESAQHRQNQNREGDDLRAGINLADQLARELAQKYFASSRRAVAEASIAACSMNGAT